jgi:predicted esterase
LVVCAPGNPILYSAARLREPLEAKVNQLDPDGCDSALREMVLIGHSQGGLLVKLAATNTEDQLLNALLGIHSIIPFLVDGNYLDGKDGLVTYRSAHVDYVESEFIVHGPHSCQNLPPAVEEVRRFLRKHLEMSVQHAPSDGPLSKAGCYP